MKCPEIDEALIYTLEETGMLDREEEHHAFTNHSRRGYRQTLRKDIKPTKNSLQNGERIEESALERGLSRLFSNYISPHLRPFIDELEFFAAHGMPGGATGKIDIHFNSLPSSTPRRPIL